MGDINTFFEIDFQTFFINCFIIIFAIVAMITVLGKFFEAIGKPIKWFKGRNNDHDLLTKTIENVKELQATVQKGMNIVLENQDEIKKFYNNRVHDREQSFQIQREWTDKINGIYNVLDEMQQTTNERFALSEEKQNKRVQADIKARIAQLYRKYDNAKKISHMELESLEDLIETYENYGGQNSFVHSIVQKEMYTWEEID